MIDRVRYYRLSLLFGSILVFVANDVHAVRNLRIASPLQALTIWDSDVKDVPVKTHRGRFLSRFRAGLEAETAARKSVAERRNRRLQADTTSNDWAVKAASADSRSRRNEERYVENAYDEALRQVEELEAQEKAAKRKKEPNKFQFVGVVNSATAANKPPIQWYARKKPASSNWSVRLIHVNRDAVIKDLFSRGKVDIFARYDNTGERDKETNQPIVASQYTVRERSWKNLWNFSPVHLITDSSGMYWRERRLRPGLYTDGNTVYEASYRFQDGRNGMHRISSFEKYLSSKSVPTKQKERIARRLSTDTPDVVLEG